MVLLPHSINLFFFLLLLPSLFDPPLRAGQRHPAISSRERRSLGRIRGSSFTICCGLSLHVLVIIIAQHVDPIAL